MTHALLIHERPARSGNSGFTLMEVIVAIAILGVSFVLVMQLFAGGLRLSRYSCDYTRAVVHAKDKMEQISMNPEEEGGSGDFEDGYRWESQIESYIQHEQLPFNLMKINVKVFWDDVANKQRFVELVSLKTISTDERL